MSRWTYNYWHNARGAALAELALVLPLLMLVLLGMVDFGKAFNEWMSQTHLANEGARLAAVNYCPDPGSDGSGNLTCNWSSIGCTNSDSNVCLAQYIDNETMSELKSGRTVSAYAPAQNRASVCIFYPNLGNTKVGDPVTVHVQVRYRWLNYIATRLDLLPGTVIRGSATMRLESLPYFGTVLTNPFPGTCYPPAPAGS